MIRKAIFLFSYLFICLTFSIHAQESCEREWQVFPTELSTSYDIHLGAMAVDKEGNTYTIGSYGTYIIFGEDTTYVDYRNGNWDMYLTKYSAEGSLLWKRTFEGTFFPVGLEVDGDNNIYASMGQAEGIIDGDTLDSSALIKFDSQGGYLWSYNFLGNPFSISTNHYGTTSFLREEYKWPKSDYAIGMVNSEGGLIWENIIVVEDTREMAVDSRNSIIVTGSFVDTFSYKGLTLQADGRSGFVLKVDSLGNAVWMKEIEPNNLPGSPSHIAVDRKDNIYITGGKSSSPYFSKYDPQGNIVWSRKSSQVLDIISNSNGEVYLYGTVDEVTFQDSIHFSGSDDFVLVKFDEEGIFQWGDLITGQDASYFSNPVLGYAKILNENIYLYGSYFLDIQFPNQSFEAAPYTTHTFIAKVEEKDQQAPSVAASALRLDEINPKSVHLSWENGDGSGRLLLLKKLGRVNPSNIEDGLVYNDGGGEFGAGSQTDEREFVVYNGGASEATITGLQPGRPYQAAVIEYNGDSNCPSLINYSQETVAKKIFLTQGGISQFAAYPNPLTQDILTVQLPDDTSGEEMLTLKNAYGQTILSRKVKKLSPNDGEVKVNISSLHLPSGIYYLNMTGQAALRLIKE